MIHASRRKILSLFAAAPASLPVAVKEIAEKAGIASIAARPPATDFGVEAIPGPYGNHDAHIKWLRDRLSRLGSDQHTFDRQRRAEEQAYRLNPNLAALRSVSPAVAYRIEVDRQMKILMERDRIKTNFDIVEALRQKASGL